MHAAAESEAMCQEHIRIKRSIARHFTTCVDLRTSSIKCSSSSLSLTVRFVLLFSHPKGVHAIRIGTIQATIDATTNTSYEQYAQDLRAQKRPSELVYDRISPFLLDHSVPVSWSHEYANFRRPLAHDCEFDGG